MFPSVVLVTPTVAGVPVLVLGGCEDALDVLDVPPLLPQAASTSPASATIAPPARKVRPDLKDIMIRSFAQGMFCSGVVAVLHDLLIAAVVHP
jgi:hypothetical protein